MPAAVPTLAARRLIRSDDHEGVAMTRAGACPDGSAYRALTSGASIPGLEAVLEHLQACASCQQAVRGLEDWSAAPMSEGRLRAREIILQAPGPGEAGRLGDYSLLR